MYDDEGGVDEERRIERKEGMKGTKLKESEVKRFVVSLISIFT